MCINLPLFLIKKKNLVCLCLVTQKVCEPFGLEFRPFARLEINTHKFQVFEFVGHSIIIIAEERTYMLTCL